MNAISGLTSVQLRLVGARFISYVIGLSDDERLGRVLKTAMDASASSDEQEQAYKEAEIQYGILRDFLNE